MRLIRSSLPEAVEACIDAAGHEFDVSRQRTLLRAASYGQAFCRLMLFIVTLFSLSKVYHCNEWAISLEYVSILTLWIFFEFQYFWWNILELIVVEALHFLIRSFNMFNFQTAFLFFLIYALNIDSQLALAAIFSVIEFKRCVKICGFWMLYAVMKLAYLLVYNNIRFWELTTFSY